MTLENDQKKKKLTGILTPFIRKLPSAIISSWLIAIPGIISVIFAIMMAVIGFTQMTWQSFSLAGLFLLVVIVNVFIQTQLSNLPQGARVFIVFALFLFCLLFTALLVSLAWIPVAIIILVFSILTSSTLLTGRWGTVGLSLGLALAVVSAIIGILAFMPQIYNTAALIFLYALMVGLLVTYIVLLATGRVQATLRVKLISIFLAIALIPLVIVTVIQSFFLQNALQSQANTSLRLAAEQVAANVDSFIQSNLDSVSKLAGLTIFRDYLQLAAAGQPLAGSETQTELNSTISILRTSYSAFVPAYSILNVFGRNIYDTNPLQIGQLEASADYFTQPRSTKRPFASQVLFSPTNGNGYIYFSATINDDQGNFLGVLKVRYDALVLQNILNGYVGLIGSRSYPVLLDNNLMRLADTITPNLIYKLVAPIPQDDLNSLIDGNRLPPEDPATLSTNLIAYSQAVSNYAQDPYLVVDVHPTSAGRLEAGAVTALSTEPWYLVFLEDQSAILTVRQQQLQYSTLVAAGIAALVGIIGTIVSTLIANPIVSLTSTAEKIAGGDLQAQATIKTRDEIETLSNAFNLMTSQLRGFINELEDRVKDRTRQLAEQNEALLFRSRQLQTVADVARGIAQTQELESLLTRIVTLISDRFGFYHVGVFLNDDQNKFTVLRAANSEGGQRMLARQHRLEIGAVGIVGYATGQGKPRIATDVGQDAVYFQNPDLPETRSEMALPLTVAGNTIGALDVQSKQPNAFTQDDITLFTALADQVAIAIYNNRLYQDAVRSLEDAQRVTRQYLSQEWTKELSSRMASGFQFTPQGLKELDGKEIPEVREAFRTGNPVVIPSADGVLSLAVPIKIRGETIGIIQLDETSGTRTDWSPDEIETIRSVADQIGLALENARLFEQTIRRAERERKVLEITSKIRSATDPNAMLEIAKEELQKALKSKQAGNDDGK
jgi:GAF domain-containing protein/HAMP domain-containing protein